MADKEHKQALEKLKKQHEYALAEADKELANDKALLEYQKSLTSSSSGSSGGSSGSSGSSGTINKTSQSKGSGRGGSIKAQVYAVQADNSGNTTINQASVKALGRGDLTATQLANLVKSGDVTQYKKNGQWYFKNNTTNSHYTAKTRDVWAKNI